MSVTTSRPPGAGVPLRIRQVNTFDIRGGAARVAYALHRGLIERGHECRMIVAHADTQDPTVVRPGPRTGIRARVLRRVRRWRIEREVSAYRHTRPAWPERFSDDRSWREWGDGAGLAACDVVHLHWIAGFVDYRRFFARLPDRIPVVWTLHDMNAFTGGCHYDDGCGRYTESCGACPQLGSRDVGDLSRRVWERKHRLFGSWNPERLYLVAPSRWLAREVSRSSIFDDRFEVISIPNGVDPATFAPQDARRARAALGVPEGRRVVLFVAYSVGQRRKGLNLLAEALRRAADGVADLFVLSVGGGSLSEAMGVPGRHLGRIQQNELLSAVYNAADVYVIPSLQDNLPSTVLESMACGTPVIGFDTGGISEMVQDGRTGVLVPPGDTDRLAEAIVDLLRDPERRQQMATLGRRRVLEEYTEELFVRRYEELYLRLVGRVRTVPASTEAGGEPARRLAGAEGSAQFCEGAR